MTVARKRHIRRVLVALDASPGSLAAAKSAVRLAALFDAELTGLFVEDLELLRLSHSPVAEQIDLLTAAIARLGSREVERQFRAQARRARRIVMRLAEEAGLECSFRVARGAVAQEIHAATTEADLVSLGRVGWSLRRRHLLGRTARKLLGEPRRCTLFSKTAGEIRPPVAVLFDASVVAHDALDLAARLVAGAPAGLAVALIGEDPVVLRQRVTDDLGSEWAATATIELGETVDRRLCRRLNQIGSRLVVVPVGAPGFGVQEVQILLAELDCPVLAVS